MTKKFNKNKKKYFTKILYETKFIFDDKHMEVRHGKEI
jgi:hypothetical protein